MVHVEMTHPSSCPQRWWSLPEHLWVHSLHTDCPPSDSTSGCPPSFCSWRSAYRTTNTSHSTNTTWIFKQNTSSWTKTKGTNSSNFPTDLFKWQGSATHDQKLSMHRCNLFTSICTKASAVCRIHCLIQKVNYTAYIIMFWLPYKQTWIPGKRGLVSLDQSYWQHLCYRLTQT